MILFRMLQSRNVPVAVAIQTQCVLVAFLSATLPIAISQARPSAIFYVAFLSVTSIETALIFLLPLAAAVLAGAHFSRNLIPTALSSLALSLIISCGTVVHVVGKLAFGKTR